MRALQPLSDQPALQGFLRFGFVVCRYVAEIRTLTEHDETGKRKPMPELSLKGVIGARPHASGNDADLGYCVNPKASTMPWLQKANDGRDPNLLTWVGSFHLLNHPPKGIQVKVFRCKHWSLVKQSLTTRHNSGKLSKAGTLATSGAPSTCYGYRLADVQGIGLLSHDGKKPRLRHYQQRRKMRPYEFRTRQEEENQEVKLIALWTIWLTCYALPQMAGPWYDDYFNAYQAAISVFILYCTLNLSTEWWTKELAAICVLQVFFNFGDAVLNYEPANYDGILAVLNAIEALILFGFGGVTAVYRMYRRHESAADDNHTHRRTSQAGQGAQAGRGHG